MTAHQMLAKVRNLIPVSKAALELGNLLGRPDTSNEEVVRVLEQDSVLTAKLLRMCNSPALGLDEQICCVDQALLLLGHGQISQMAAALAFRGPLAIPLPAYAMAADDLWHHSLLTATAAQMASAEGLSIQVDGSLAFTVGLLHDIGKLVTNEFMTRAACIAIRQHMAEGRSPVEAEREILGADHAEVGAALAYMWRLPDVLVEALALHHQPALEPQPRLSTLAALANFMAQCTIAARSRQELASCDIRVLAALGLIPEQLENLLGRIVGQSVVEDELMAIPA
jgi:putative nucleotidyltransferase with HDIG domain